MEEARKSDLIDIAMVEHHRTARALLASDDGDSRTAVWLPLSRIEIEPQRDGTVIVTMPEDLAVQKGLV